MPLFLDIHRNVTAASPEEVQRAHVSDLEAQEAYGVKYLKYWFDSHRRTICCLVDGPNTEACAAVHRDAHGDLADEIIEVETDMLTSFLGAPPTDDAGCALNRDGTLDTAFRTVLFTDIVGSTSLTQDLGDERAMDLLRAHDRIVREAMGDDGREIKHTGDGVLASFTEASAAVAYAVRIQRDLAVHRAEHPGLPISIRVGMSAGEPVAENRDIFGATVQLAARICAEARPNEILVANVVRELCLGKKIEFEDRGAADLKGFPQPVQLCAVPWADNRSA